MSATTAIVIIVVVFIVVMSVLVKANGSRNHNYTFDNYPSGNGESYEQHRNRRK